MLAITVRTEVELVGKDEVLYGFGMGVLGEVVRVIDVCCPIPGERPASVWCSKLISSEVARLCHTYRRRDGDSGMKALNMLCV